MKHWRYSATERIPLAKYKFAVTHIIRQTEIPTLLGSWFINTPSVKILCPQKILLSLYFRKNISLSDGLLRIGQVSSLSCKISYGWITTNCCFMSCIIYKLWSVETLCQIFPSKFNTLCKVKKYKFLFSFFGVGCQFVLDSELVLIFSTNQRLQ